MKAIVTISFIASLLLHLVLTKYSGPQRDFYSILGVPKSASPAEIKKAYRALSLKWHPDKNPDDASAVDKFTDLSAAYEALSDPDKRRKYDKCGEECLNEPENQGGMNPFGDIFGGMFG